jgi:hypothetical protein
LKKISWTGTTGNGSSHFPDFQEIEFLEKGLLQILKIAILIYLGSGWDFEKLFLGIFVFSFFISKMQAKKRGKALKQLTNENLSQLLLVLGKNNFRP